MVPVLSSSIAAVGYDAAASMLLVRFHDEARTYSYLGVPVGTYRAFLSAPSKGRFLAHFIKGRYPYQRVA
jgi:KTSC domain-containing protein